jgi:hypothetical protein
MYYVTTGTSSLPANKWNEVDGWKADVKKVFLEARGDE